MDLVGPEEKERAALDQWVNEAKVEWPKLNAEAYKQYLACFYEGFYHPPKKRSFWGPLPVVVGIGLLGAGFLYFIRRG